MNFFKMHALGNDFCVFGSPFDKNPLDKEFIKAVCDRHYGVGCDCLVYVGRSETDDYFMHVYNPDGFEAEICGNALRCSARYVCEKGFYKKHSFDVQTISGTKKVNVDGDAITTEIGIADIIATDYLNIAGYTIPYVYISIGNPHCVIFVKNITDEEFSILGKCIESHPKFPGGTNVEFAHITDDAAIEMRVWERGIGETYSCTTGSCACVAAANYLGYNMDFCNVIQRGGTVNVSVDEKRNISVTGKCTTVFKGNLIDIAEV